MDELKQAQVLRVHEHVAPQLHGRAPLLGRSAPPERHDAGLWIARCVLLDELVMQQVWLKDGSDRPARGDEHEDGKLRAVVVDRGDAAILVVDLPAVYNGAKRDTRERL